MNECSKAHGTYKKKKKKKAITIENVMQFSTVIGPQVFDAPASAYLIATYLIRHIATCIISRFTISCNKAHSTYKNVRQ